MSKYLYNGVELPALPEYDKGLYPYALIVYNVSPTSGTQYYLYLTSYKAVFEIMYKYPTIPPLDITGYALYIDFVDENIRGLRYQCAPNGTEWELINTYTDKHVSNGMYMIGEDSPDFCKWTNFDIYYSGYDLHGDLANTLYLAASVDPSTTPQDFYIVKNGVGQKQDVYKVVGGQCVKLDEYLS